VVTPKYPEEDDCLCERAEIFEKIVEHYVNEFYLDNPNVALVMVTHGYMVEAPLKGINAWENEKGFRYTCVSLLKYDKDSKYKSKNIYNQVSDHLEEAIQNHEKESENCDN